ncbi:MAG: hypothetical protein AVDCRST_MAG79-807 [uncultured Thermoleophilia bacterium]|uniref:Uncharacterized protein n=1 Tax=uncultured Thermoleophilia bacterium TaxID=1497501 RepID=A0A6J4TSL3_9ACTN|nr:MAG: hypothetical protein AVDCRST_MAG79-807 [uncultured Thermoleophilia bacterium]
MNDRDDDALFRDLDDDPPLPPHRVAWRPAVLVAFGVTVVTLILTIAATRVFDLEGGTGDELSDDAGALVALTVATLALHAVLLRYGLRRFAQYDVGIGWAVLAALLTNVLAGLLYVLGLFLAVPVQAALLRFRSEPRASLVGR